MRNRSFPDVAFKYNFDEGSSSSSIEYYHLQNREPLLTNKCNCPNQHETAKQDGVSGGYGSFTSIGAILVLFILLVIISKACLV